MLRKILFIAIILVVLILPSCKKNKSSDSNVSHVYEVKHVAIDGNKFNYVNKDGETLAVEPAAPNGTPAEVAYVLGANIVQNIKTIYNQAYSRSDSESLKEEEIAALLQGIIDANSGIKIEEDYMMSIGEKLNKEVEANNKKKKEAGEKYFKSLEAKSNIKKTDSGLLYEVIKEGDGEVAILPDSTVNVDYTMSVYSETAEDNKILADKNEGIDFTVSNLIPGAIEGLQLMREGAEYTFYIIPELGYGSYPVSPVIGADSFLIFNIKINKILPREESTSESESESKNTEAEN